ncbi:MAG: aldo/keto reductase [Bifidobacteriaceae bacterium]|jgi:aryl-alcohol dehydrogenase-like predicted oxidoreductase|nr:aldo/keto reductase [Bifidobacteriaceae bacterium]MCI1979005.1 aldo/keto reductase [Bifidobacteriaceae bacterium]
MTQLGKSGIDIYPLALGGNTFGWTSDEKESDAVLDAYVDAGGNLIDTADVYSAWVPGNAGGESEIILGRWLATRANRSKVLIATKVSQHPQYPGLSAKNIAAAADESLLRLGTDYIDLYYAHFDDEKTPLAETAEALDALVKQGKVRAIGLSNYSTDRLREYFAIARENGFTLPVALEPHYNLVTRTNYEQNLQQIAEEENLAVFPYYSLASGFLTGKYRTADDLKGRARGGDVKGYMNADGLAVVAELDRIAQEHGVEIATVALAWLRSRSQIAAPIASARTPEQLPALVASTTLELSKEDVAALDTVSSKLMK